MAEYEEPPKWLPGDIVRAELLNVYSGNDEFFKDWVNGQIPQKRIYAGLEAEMPVEPELGEIFYATDSEVLFIFDGDTWREFREIPPELIQHKIDTPIDHPNNSVTPIKLSAIDEPANDEVPVFNEEENKFEWKPVVAKIIPTGLEDEMPEEPQEGEIFYAKDTENLYVYDGNVWMGVKMKLMGSI